MVAWNKMLISMLKKHDVKKIIIKKYDNIDPSKHEVISIINNKKYDNKIIAVFQSGYTLHEQVIRYAKVSILKVEEN